jgi:hypothetical protein
MNSVCGSQDRNLEMESILAERSTFQVELNFVLLATNVLSTIKSFLA